MCSANVGTVIAMYRVHWRIEGGGGQGGLAPPPPKIG